MTGDDDMTPEFANIQISRDSCLIFITSFDNVITNGRFICISALNFDSVEFKMSLIDPRFISGRLPCDNFERNDVTFFAFVPNVIRLGFEAKYGTLPVPLLWINTVSVG
jgi:hypothetical protein